MKSLPCALLLLSGALNLHAATITLNPTDDSYVRNSVTGSNFGNDVIFVANNFSGVRVSFLRFDLSGIIEPITNIKLDLTTQTSQSPSVGFNVYGLISGETWTESGINWTNAPAVVNSFTTTSGTLSQYLDTADLYGGGTIFGSFNSGLTADTLNTAINTSSGAVFDFIAADSNKIITFVIAEQDPANGAGVGWHSSEATTANFRPQLTITTVPEPSAVALGGLGLFALLRRKRLS